MLFDYRANLDFFQGRSNAGAPSLDQTVRFLHISRPRDAPSSSGGWR